MATGKPKRHKGRQSYSSINGRIHLRRVRWHCPQEGSETPLDRLVDEVESTISEGVREMACRSSQGTTSFQQAAQLLLRTAHVEVSKETLRQLVEGEGRAVLKAQRGATLLPDWSALDCTAEQRTTRVYLGCDGVKVPLVTDAEKQRRRAKIREKRQRRGRKSRPLPRAKPGADNAYKEFKVGYFYDERKERRLVGVTAGNHEAAGRMLARMAEQVQLSQAQERVALIDGAPWIRNQLEFHGLTSDIGLDFWHLPDYAQKTRRKVFGEESADGQQWLNELMHAFKQKGYDAASDRLTDLRQPLRGEKRAAVNQLLQYMAERRDMIRYPEFRRRHGQIGSGPTEAECKTTPQRIKGRGRRWDSANAEALMALAALHDSGLWNQRWPTLNPQTN